MYAHDVFGCFLILFIFVEVICAQEQGLCGTRTMYINKLRRITFTRLELEKYTETKNCPRGQASCLKTRNVPRIRTRMQSYKEPQVRKTCCKGYRINNSINKCMPICIVPCKHGTCYTPNKCMCDVGYVINPTNAFECLPHCEQPCLNGYCTNPNICSCNNGYELQDNNYQCFPVCKNGCLNGICNKPGECICNTGYTLDPTDKYRCKPICDNQCINGECTAPNVCTCNSGFETISGSSFDCQPICDNQCINGECTAPNVCTCNSGFEMIPGNSFDCQPICTTKCVNAECVSPNECQCFDGYQFNGIINDTNYFCDPICSNPCRNADCVSPNECKCRIGYNKSHNNLFECHPFCSQPCINGICTEPETCTCDPGYENDSHNQFSCNPICEPDCENGDCFLPDVCVCHAGFLNDINNNSRCIPNCTNGTPDGNNCKCWPGFAFKENSWNICEQLCSQKCINGECVSKEKCECEIGYELISPFECKPICDKCINGECISPGVCRCYENYLLSITDEGVCVPQCNPACVNGNCSAPNECTCHEGYKIINNASVCEPQCAGPCINGICTEPNTCSCKSGYTRDSFDNYVCRPFCPKSCENGYCSSPNNCLCYKGFEKINSEVCEPVCSKNCTNAFCSAPETCKCIDGYIKDIDDESSCVPICHEDSCKNGTCVTPDKCECNTGFELYNGSCVSSCSDGCVGGTCLDVNTCVCPKDHTEEKVHGVIHCLPNCNYFCGNGTCTAADVCSCFAGYIQTNSSPSCQPACTSCENGTCVAPENCICNEGYEKDADGICFETSLEAESCRSENPLDCLPPCEDECNEDNCREQYLCSCPDGVDKNITNLKCISSIYNETTYVQVERTVPDDIRPTENSTLYLSSNANFQTARLHDSYIIIYTMAGVMIIGMILLGIDKFARPRLFPNTSATSCDSDSDWRYNETIFVSSSTTKKVKPCEYPVYEDNVEDGGSRKQSFYGEGSELSNKNQIDDHVAYCTPVDDISIENNKIINIRL